MRWSTSTDATRNALRSSSAVFAALVFFAGIGDVRADSVGTTVYTFGAPIDVVLTARVSSESAHTGDPFYFKTVKDVALGNVDLPAGTPGSGRLATVVAATRKTPGQLALQVDDLVGAAATVWINIDTTVTPRGHYATSRDIVLDPGTTFRVTSIAPRKTIAPLVETETPSPEPALVSPSPAAMMPSSPAMAATPIPEPMMSEMPASPAASDSPLPSASPLPSDSPSAEPVVSPSATP